MPKAKPQPYPNDEDDPQPMKRVLTSAADSTPPATTAASSVFDLARKTKPAPAPRAARYDFNSIAIQTGVPIPPPPVGGGSMSPYAALLRRMKPGDMVELPYRQAYGLLSMAKKMKIACTRRTLEPGILRVWRT